MENFRRIAEQKILEAQRVGGVSLGAILTETAFRASC